MPRGSNLTREHQQAAAARRLATMDAAAFHRAGGQARAAQMTAAERAAWGAKGAATTIARYGFDFLLQKMAAAKAARPPSACEAAVIAHLAGWGLVAGVDYARNVPVVVAGPDGAPRGYELDIVLPGARCIECDGAYWHGQPSRALLDAHKDAALAAAGWRVLRLPESLLRDADLTHRTVYAWLLSTGGLGEVMEEAA